MLRNAVLAFGAALLIGGGVALWLHTPPGLVLVVEGVLIVGGLVFERSRYKRLIDAAPGPDWERTTERFVDDETGKLVTVFVKPATGERVYVKD
jgi:hypothetical protein